MENTDIPDFNQSLPMLLNSALDSIMPVYRDLFAKHNLTEQQWRVLRVLWSEQRVTAADLSRNTLLSAPSLVGILDRLEGKHLVARVRSTTDRREVYIVTTAEGRELRSKIMPNVGRIHDEIRSRVSTQEWDVMVKTLAKLSGKPAAMIRTEQNATTTIKTSA